MQKYAFIDRDGTIIHEFGRDKDDIAYVPRSTDDVQFVDGAIEGMKQLIANGYKLVLATNQPYLGTPRNPSDTYNEIMDYVYNDLSSEGVTFVDEMVCPHEASANCDCRKPKIGGLDSFLRKHQEDIDLENSLMFGDRETDRLFAENLKVNFVEVETNGNFTIPEKYLNNK